MALILSGAANAQDTALIIGNSDYNPPGAGGPDLPGVVPDVALMNAKLANAGWTTVVRMNRTAAQMAADIAATRPPAGKRYIVYYAGHGNNAGGQHGQWVGIDGSELTAAAYLGALGSSRDRTLTILDSCGGGAFADAVSAHNAAVGFITSTTDLECADKTPAGGQFTQCFGNALNTAADANGDGQTTAAEAGAYGIANCSRPDQHPTYDGDHPGWVLGRPKPVPTVSEWGLIVLTLLILTGATIVLRRRRSATLARNC